MSKTTSTQTESSTQTEESTPSDRIAKSTRQIMFRIALILVVVVLGGYWITEQESQGRDIERSDCAREIGNTQSTIRDDLDVAIARALLVLGTDGFNSPMFDSATVTLELAVTKVESLEPIQAIVERECP